MKITLELLLYFIHELNPRLLCRTPAGNALVGVKEFYREMEAPDTAYVYVGSLKEVLARTQEFPPGVSVLATGDTAISPAQISAFPGTLILVDAAYPVPYLLNELVDLFSRLINWDKEMHIAALEGKPIQTLMDLSTEILAFPTIIFNATFDVLAATRGAHGAYDYFDHTVQKGYTDANVMELIYKENIFHQLQSGTPLVASAVGDTSQTNIYLSFQNEGTLLGYGCVFHGTKTPRRGYLDLLKIFSDNVRFCLKRDFEHSRFGKMMYETFLLKLMAQKGASREQLAEQLAAVEGLKRHGRFVLGVCAFDRTESVPLPFLTRLLDQELWNVQPFLFENQICLLKTLTPDAPADAILSDWETNTITQLLHNYPFSLGSSLVFSDILDLYYAYLQAKASLSFGKKEEPHHLYHSIYYAHLFSVMERELPLPLLQPEFYRQIKDYDASHNTNYLSIILTYLECDCNATHAATKLFLHRNTVRNAVQFVNEHWQIDVSQTETKKMLVFSELIDHYLDANHH